MTAFTVTLPSGELWVPQFVAAINAEKCIGCGRCFKVCSRDVLNLVGVDEDGNYIAVDIDGDDDDDVVVDLFARLRAEAVTIEPVDDIEPDLGAVPDDVAPDDAAPVDAVVVLEVEVVESPEIVDPSTGEETVEATPVEETMNCPMCGGSSWEQSAWSPFSRAASTLLE